MTRIQKTPIKKQQHNGAIIRPKIYLFKKAYNKLQIQQATLIPILI